MAHDRRGVRLYAWSSVPDRPVPFRVLEAAGLTAGLVEALGPSVVELGIDMLVHFPVGAAELGWALGQGWGEPMLQEHVRSFEQSGLARHDLLVQTCLGMTRVRTLLPDCPAAVASAFEEAQGQEHDREPLGLSPLLVALATARHTDAGDTAAWYAAWSADPDREGLGYEEWLSGWVDAGFEVWAVQALVALPAGDPRRVTVQQRLAMTALRGQPGRAGGTYNSG